MFRSLIKTHNFVTFYKFLIHLGVHHTDSTERRWCPFINTLPEILEVLSSDSCCHFSAGHLREGIMCFLQNFLCPNVSLRGIVISALKDLPPFKRVPLSIATWRSWMVCLSLSARIPGLELPDTFLSLTNVQPSGLFSSLCKSCSMFSSSIN